MKKEKSSTFSRINFILNNQKGNFMGGDGGDGATEGDNGMGEPTSSDGGDGGLQYAYPEGFDEKLKGHASLLKYADDKGNFNQANIMKAYVHASSMIGKDKLSMPDETWTDDQYSDLYNKLGRPEDIKEYSIDNNLPDSIEKNEEFFNAFKQTAYEAGLAPKQAQKVSDFINSFLGESVTKNSELAEQEYTQKAQALQNDWGDKYDYKLNRAFKALEQFASNDEINAMKQEGLLSSPTITRLFDKIADGMAEDSLKVKGGSTFGITSEDAAREIESFYKPGHPFITRGHPEQKFYQEKMQKLQRIKLSSRKG